LKGYSKSTASKQKLKTKSNKSEHKLNIKTSN